MELFLILIMYFLMFLCFLVMEISHRKYQKSRDEYIKWIMSDWTKKLKNK